MISLCKYIFLYAGKFQKNLKKFQVYQKQQKLPKLAKKSKFFELSLLLEHRP